MNVRKIKFGKWISVDDALPKCGESVLAWSDSCGGSDPGAWEAYFTADHKWRVEHHAYQFYDSVNVTHWMPMPKGPDDERPQTTV